MWILVLYITFSPLIKKLSSVVSRRVPPLTETTPYTELSNKTNPFYCGIFVVFYLLYGLEETDSFCVLKSWTPFSSFFFGWYCCCCCLSSLCFQTTIMFLSFVVPSPGITDHCSFLRHFTDPRKIKVKTP